MNINSSRARIIENRLIITRRRRRRKFKKQSGLLGKSFEINRTKKEFVRDIELPSQMKRLLLKVQNYATLFFFFFLPRLRSRISVIRFADELPPPSHSSGWNSFRPLESWTSGSLVTIHPLARSVTLRVLKVDNKLVATGRTARIVPFFPPSARQSFKVNRPFLNAARELSFARAWSKIISNG